MSCTRGKLKKQSDPAFAEDLHSELFRRIVENDCVGDGDLELLYNTSKPVCQGCRVNCKDSPNCFCQVIPPPGGSRKHGLWHKSSEAASHLGPDPAEILRPSPISPPGLTNLGATCYVNSVLQCLYRIKGFRRGFFAAEADLVQRRKELHKLALLFGELHSGRKRAVDSGPLAEALELNKQTQQDGQEFLKLLLALLEKLLGQSRNSQARGVVQDLFRGTLSHVTRCAKCGQESDASKQVVDFYELELNVKGLSSLEESLDDYLSEEQLQGDNQFLCESCNTRVDATRCSKLRSLPPVLNLQLKRFVFDAKTAMKKKVTSSFKFPRSIDMRSRLSMNGMNETNAIEPLIYDLSAVLIHKGGTANSGHYIAKVRDDCTGQWWEFDDEEVTSLGLHPFGVDSARKNGTQKEAQVKHGEVDRCSELLAVKHVPDSSENCLTSADAYMLMYTLRDLPEPFEHGSSSKVEMGPVYRKEQVDIECSEKQGMEQADPLLPDYLRFEVEEHNLEYENKCMQYKLRKEKHLLDILERKNEVRTILAEAPVQGQSQPFFWISSVWLRNWADSLHPPPPIDNNELLCEHGKVSPKNVSLMKRISEVAWMKLHSKYGGGPSLSNNDCCKDCIMENARAVVSANSYRHQRGKFKKMLEEALTNNEMKGKLYFVSKTWLHNWLRRKAADAPSEHDAFPTAAITCPHGGLSVDNAAGAKRQAVPEEIWNYFFQIAMQVKEDSPNACPIFPSDTNACTTCQDEITQVSFQEQDLRVIKMEQRQRHDLLFSGKSIIVEPEQVYYLVPSMWLSQWRSYLGTNNKKLTADEPICLEGCILSLLCQKHEGLSFRPPTLQRTRRGELVQMTTNSEIFTVVSEDDWRYFCEQWDVSPSKGIKAFLEPMGEEGQSTMEEKVAHLSEISLSEVSGLEQDAIDCKGSVVPCLRTQPEVCKECTEERESSELIKKLHYVNEEIYVDLVPGKEPPRSVLTMSQTERRVSKRARRGSASSNMRAILKVSGETTVYQLKMLIWEAFTVVKENQRVHFGGKELLDESATLADMNILPGAYLWVIDTGLHENRDIAEELSDREIDFGKIEEGFGGTLLARLPNFSESFLADVPQACGRQSQFGYDDNVHEESANVCECSVELHKTDSPMDDVEVHNQPHSSVVSSESDLKLESVPQLVAQSLERLGKNDCANEEEEIHRPFKREKRIVVSKDTWQEQSEEFQINLGDREIQNHDTDRLNQNVVSCIEVNQSLGHKEEEQSLLLQHSAEKTENSCCMQAHICVLD